MAARDESDLQARLAALTVDDLEVLARAWKWMGARSLDLNADREDLPPDQREGLNAVESKWAVILA